MKGPTSVLAANLAGEATIRVAAAGDIHCGDVNRDAVSTAFEAIDGTVDLILLAGDLTTHGEPEQAAILADVCRQIETPVVAVLGNHDLHAGKAQEVAGVITEAGIDLLDRGHTTHAVGECKVGIAGVKGFVGGFRGRGLPDFGEPSLRKVYAETGAEVDALAEGLREIALCPFRLVLMHYAPMPETLHGEPPEIWPFLGSDRLAAPILEHRPDLVLHGHAHAGRLEGSLSGIPVFNVSVPVMRQDFWVFELSDAETASSAIH
jgi:Icc-related predicted phosphoesterase